MTGNDLSNRAFRRILLIKPSSPGDIIHALPVLHGLRGRFPAAHIAWLVARPFVDLVERDPALSEVIPFDRARYGRLGSSLSISREFLSFLAQLRKRRFDLVIDLQGLFRSGFLARATGAAVRIGFADAREFAHLAYTHKLPRAESRRAGVHAADRNYEIAGMFGFSEVAMDFSIATTDADRDAAEILLEEGGIVREKPFVALAPATRWETKNWAAERFGALAAQIRERFSLRSVLVGGPGDSTIGDAAVAASQGAAANFCGRTSLREMVALIRRAAIVVTADSTPMHVAVATNRPLVALFGPTNAHRTGPYGRMADVIRLDLECSPCYLRRLPQCPHDHRCMRDLGVKTVLEAVAARIEPTVAAHAGC